MIHFQACHSFTPNSQFGKLDHARFGLIMAVWALEDLKPHEEILVSYNYAVATAPQWYQVKLLTFSWFRAYN